MISIQGNPNPPGVPTISNYKGLPGRPWNTPARSAPPAVTPIRHHAGMPSNMYITQAYTVRPWNNEFDKKLREGQICVMRRQADPKTPDLHTIINISQLNQVLAKNYDSAKERLERGAVNTVSLDDITSVPESVIAEYIDADTADIPDGKVAKVVKLLQQSPYYALSGAAIAAQWNLIGIINNVSMGTSPEVRIDMGRAGAVVANFVVGKGVFALNLWGDAKEGDRLYLVLKRVPVTGRVGEYAAYALLPYYSQGGRENKPSFAQTSYLDETDRVSLGYVYTVGTVSEQSPYEVPNGRKTEAINANGAYGAEASHESYGSLPKIRVQYGV